MQHIDFYTPLSGADLHLAFLSKHVKTIDKSRERESIIATMKQQPSREFYLPNNKPDNKPEVERFVRFSTTTEQLKHMLEVARVVGIAAEPITDPEVAGETYAAQAHAELASGLIYEDKRSRPDPVFFRETAQKRVESGDTMVLFTTTGPQAMQPFADEYKRRFGHDAY